MSMLAVTPFIPLTASAGADAEVYAAVSGPRAVCLPAITAVASCTAVLGDTPALTYVSVRLLEQVAQLVVHVE